MIGTEFHNVGSDVHATPIVRPGFETVDERLHVIEIFLISVAAELSLFDALACALIDRLPPVVTVHHHVAQNPNIEERIRNHPPMGVLVVVRADLIRAHRFAGQLLDVQE